MSKSSQKYARRSERPEQLTWVWLLLLGWALVGGCSSASAPSPNPQQEPELAPVEMTLTGGDSAARQHLRITSPAELMPVSELREAHAPPHYHPFLDGEDPSASVAIGTTSDGYLVNGVALAQPSRDYQVLPKQYARDLGYGSRPLIETITGAASSVARRFPGAVTFIGNVGRSTGGDIPWSVSHNTGLDADLAYFSRSPLGWQTRPSMLLHFEADGHSAEHSGFYRFDVERNAAFVEALFEHPASLVQYFFIARPLKAKLVARWEKTRLEPELLAQLKVALRQPGDAAPHDDHLHLRIACPREDVCGGCVQKGRERAWIPDQAGARLKCIDSLRRELRKTRDGEQRARVIERLAILDARAHTRAIRAALDDDSARVRRAAAHALAALEDRGAVGPLIARYEIEPTDQTRCAIIQSLARLGGDAAAKQIASALGADGRCRETRLRAPSRVMPPVDLDQPEVPLVRIAAIAAGTLDARAPVAALIELLDEEDSATRSAAATSLYRLTNHRVGRYDWSDPGLSEAERREGSDGWRRWYIKNGRRSRDEWLVDGFRLEGFEVSGLGRDGVPQLIEAIKGSSHVSFNAQRELMAFADHHPPSLLWPAALHQAQSPQAPSSSLIIGRSAQGECSGRCAGEAPTARGS